MFTFTVTGDRTLTALFTVIPYTPPTTYYPPASETTYYPPVTSTPSQPAAQTDVVEDSIVVDAQPDGAFAAQADVETKITKSGNMSFTVNNTMVNSIINEVKAAAKEAGERVKDLTVAINAVVGADSPEEIKNVSAKLDKAALSSLASSDAGLSIFSPLIDVTIDSTTVQEILDSVNGTVSFTAKLAARNKVKDSKTRAVIGSRPLFEVNIRNTKNRLTDDLETGVYTFSIKYTPAPDEVPFVVRIVNNEIEYIRDVEVIDGRLYWNAAGGGIFGVAVD